MRDISDKFNTFRTALARGTVEVGSQTSRRFALTRFSRESHPGGSRGSDPSGQKHRQIIPFCRPVLLEGVSVDFKITDGSIEVEAIVKAHT